MDPDRAAHGEPSRSVAPQRPHHGPAGGARCRFRFRFRLAAVPQGGREAGRREPAARPNMAEYVQVLKRALKHIGGHGGARGAIMQLLR